MSRFELEYELGHRDQLANNTQFHNRPVNARLKQYPGNRPHRTSSQPSSAFPFERGSVPRCFSDESAVVDDQIESLVLGHNPFTYLQSLENFPEQPPFNRSLSLPLLRKGTSDSDIFYNSIPQTHQSLSRKSSVESNISTRRNSWLFNCTPQESDGRTTQDTTITSLDEGTSEEEQEDGEAEPCSRHHHRRGSVAIKFDTPEVVGPSGTATVDHQLKNALSHFTIK